jgi:formylglycine-generating enzyme required for sulfatase activity
MFQSRFPRAALAACLVLLAAGAAHAQGRSARAPRKWAVVIGVNEYLKGLPSLHYCVADARRIHRELVEHCGYDENRVLLLTDDQPKTAQRPYEKENLLRQVGDWLLRAEKEDTMLIFFSGHGLVDDAGAGYLAPQNCDPNDMKETACSQAELIARLKRCEATKKMLILDCCHAGAEKGVGHKGASSQDVASTFKFKGLITLASCSKDEESHEWQDKKQGLFTYFLTSGLAGAADRDKDGIVDHLELYRYLNDTVPNAAIKEFGVTQTPVINETSEGIMELARSSRTTQPQIPITPPVEGPPGVTIIENSLGMKLALIPAGQFAMGSRVGEYRDDDDASESRLLEPSRDVEESPQHRVTISKPFYLGIHEVSQGEYRRVMGANPARFIGDNRPVEQVSWDDAVEFCRRLSAMPDEQAAGRVYELPTEAQWEYACRAQTLGPFAFGERLPSEQFNFNGSEAIGERGAEFRKSTIPVGASPANAFGLHEMHGNVWEWCRDGHRDYTSQSVTDPIGIGLDPAVRGGNWAAYAQTCRSSVRRFFSRSTRSDKLGFRVLCTTN